MSWKNSKAGKPVWVPTIDNAEPGVYYVEWKPEYYFSLAV